MALCGFLTEAFYFKVVFLVSLSTGYQFTAGSPNGSTSTSEATVHSISYHFEPERQLTSNANNSNSNWVLILVIVTLFVGAILIIVQVSLQTWRTHVTRKRKYDGSDTERRLLLHDQGVEVVESHQQPSAMEQNEELSEQLGSNISIPIKQQMPTDELFALPEY